MRAEDAPADCEHVALATAPADPNTGITYLATEAGGTQAGTPKDDILLGGPGADTLSGGGGNDVLWGVRQPNILPTTPDILDGGPNDDTIYGNDVVHALNRIHATISCGDGRDVVHAGPNITSARDCEQVIRGH